MNRGLEVALTSLLVGSSVFAGVAAEADTGPASPAAQESTSPTGVVDSLTTPYQEVTRQEDGSFVATLSAVPVRVPDGEGGWQDVDTTLVEHADGSIGPKAALNEIRFSGGWVSH